jgi:hypothetical protein
VFAACAVLYPPTESRVLTASSASYRNTRNTPAPRDAAARDHSRHDKRVPDKRVDNSAFSLDRSRRPIPLKRGQAKLEDRDYPLTAVATRYESPIYSASKGKRRRVGYARRGSNLPVGRPVAGSGCSGGRWHPAHGGGQICSRIGFKVSEGSERSNGKVSARRHASRPLPYRYAKVIKSGALRLYRLPSSKENQLIARALKRNRDFPSIVQKRMAGIYFVAMNGIPLESTYVRTIRGYYVRSSEIRPVSPPTMRGERLSGGRALPLAFVHGEDRPVYWEAGRSIQKQGTLSKHARFHVLREVRRGKRRFVVGPEGLLLEREAVRVARRVARPEEVPSDAKWIQIDLVEQTLVAYEGDTPVYATLISSGKEGHETPTGLYRIKEKHVTTTMRGKDPVEGWYEIGEVPWTMFYKKYYAVHGAYWHDDFGQTRSHGCTNLSPADARWIFRWSDPDVPEGWHGRSQSGTWINFTD